MSRQNPFTSNKHCINKCALEYHWYLSYVAKYDRNLNSLQVPAARLHSLLRESVVCVRIEMCSLVWSARLKPVVPLGRVFPNYCGFSADSLISFTYFIVGSFALILFALLVTLSDRKTWRPSECQFITDNVEVKLHTVYHYSVLWWTKCAIQWFRVVVFAHAGKGENVYTCSVMPRRFFTVCDLFHW